MLLNKKNSLSILFFLNVSAFAQVLPPPLIEPGPTEPKLIYRPIDQPLTVEDLAKLQSEKMNEEFRKRAGFTSVPPVVPKKTSIVKEVKPTVKNTITVVGVYGSGLNKKADVLINGKLHTLTESAQISIFKLNKINLNPQSNSSIEVSYSSVEKATKKNKTVEITKNETVKSGESLEVNQ